LCRRTKWIAGNLNFQMLKPSGLELNNKPSCYTQRRPDAITKCRPPPRSILHAAVSSPGST
jgi:hypothetical protein